MKLVIGSAQLGMNYGLFNNKKINRKEFKKIEKLVLRSNINFIDTATGYGNSENIIGNSRLKKLHIITKIKLPRKKNIHIRNWVSKEISRLLIINLIYNSITLTFTFFIVTFLMLKIKAKL